MISFQNGAVILTELGRLSTKYYAYLVSMLGFLILEYRYVHLELAIIAAGMMDRAILCGLELLI